MWERGSYWELSKRPAKEMEIDWEKFLSNFSAYDEDFFKQEEVDFFFLFLFSLLLSFYSLKCSQGQKYGQSNQEMGKRGE